MLAMLNSQKINIEGIEYFIVDSIQNLRAEDSFIFRKNKLSMFKGNGESRKYVGSYTGPPGKRLSNFFQYSDWGKRQIDGKRVYTTIQSKCFFSKNNLLRYLHDSKIEYQKQEQVYRFDISELFSNYKETINNLVEDKLFFSIYDVSDSVENKQSRGYIRSDDKIWGIWRKIILPKISYLSILKLIPCDDIKQKHHFFSLEFY